MPTLEAAGYFGQSSPVFRFKPTAKTLNTRGDLSITKDLQAGFACLTNYRRPKGRPERFQVIADKLKA
jgi:hypothetical protein